MLTSLLGTLMTRPERMLPATSMARHSLVNSSITVRHLSCRPLAQASNTKSDAQTWLTPVASDGRGRLAACLVGEATGNQGPYNAGKL